MKGSVASSKGDGREGRKEWAEKEGKGIPPKVTVSRIKHCLSGSAWRFELDIIVTKVQRQIPCSQRDPINRRRDPGRKSPTP